MDWYTKVKKYFDKGLYTVDDVRVFVASGKITEEQFTEITGEPYNVEEVVALARTTTKTRTRTKTTKQSSKK